MKPRLKDYALARAAGRLVLEQEPGVTRLVEDPDGEVGLLVRLADGTRTVAELTAEMRVRVPAATADEVGDALAALDEAALLEDATAQSRLTARQRERYASNLAFFATYATLEHSRFRYQERLLDAHVVLLGVGGIGSALLPILAGLGVGRVTLVDHDTIALDNLTRQFLYGEAEIGLPKVGRAAARASALNSEIDVETLQRRVRRPEDVSSLLGDADLVLSAIDDPPDVVYWVNDACVAARVPFVAAGTIATRGFYYSVSPGVSGCTGCWDPDPEPGYEPEAEADSTLPRRRVNRATGASVGLLASLVGLEAMRYLTGFAAPVAAGRQWLADLTTGELAIGWQWERRPDCRVCSAPSAPGAVAVGDAATVDPDPPTEDAPMARGSRR